jgi:hypothetical protein
MKEVNEGVDIEGTSNVIGLIKKRAELLLKLFHIY